MTSLRAIENFLSTELRIGDFQESSLNGLQVEGTDSVRKVATSVDCALPIAQSARDAGAQLLLVHHGLLWGQDQPITGGYKTILKTLLEAEITLYAAHLPLDAHEVYGNNYCLARMLELEELKHFLPYGGQYIGCKGVNKKKLSLSAFKAKLEELPGASPDMLVFAHGPSTPSSVGVVTGSGSEALYRFRDDGIDTLISGEPKYFAYHFARDNKLNVIFAGHYATETLGVQELGKAVAEQFGLEWMFIDFPTGL